MSQLKEAVAAIKAGNKETGKQLLREFLETNPTNENAWLWLAKAVDSKQERIICLEKVLQLNPDNEVARLSLEKLRKPAGQSAAKLGKKSASGLPVRQANQTSTILAIGIAILAGCCIIFGIASVIQSETQPRTRKDSASTLQPGAPPTEISDPTPTSTQVVPPTEASNPSSSLSPEEEAYLTTTATQLILIGDSFTEIAILSSNPQLTDQDWQIDISTRIIVVQQAHQELLSIQPPPRMAGLHTDLIDATSACNEAVTLLQRGIDDVDSATLEAANSWMQTCNVKVAALPQKMAELQ